MFQRDGRHADPARRPRARTTSAGAACDATATATCGRRSTCGRRAARRGARVGVADGPPREIRRRPRPSGLLDDTVAFWRDWLAQSTYTGPLAGDRAALGDHPEADDVRARPAASSPRRRRACPSRSAASATGTTATPGSATRRSRSTRCSGWASARRRPRSAAGCATGCTSRSAASGGPLNIMYRVDGSSDLTEESSTTGRATGAPARCASATAPPTSCSWTSTARRSTASTSRDQRGLHARPPGLAARSATARLAGRQLGPARRGHLGDPRRPAGLHLRPGDVLGGVRPGDPAGDRARAPGRDRRWSDPARRDLRAGHGAGAGTPSGGVRAALRRRVLDSSLLRMPTVGFIARRTRCGCRPCGRWTHELVTDSLVYRYDPEASPDGLRGLGGHVLAVHLHLRRRAGPRRAGSTTPG